MTYGAFPQDFESYGYAKAQRRPVPQAALCAVALALSTTVGLWALYARPLAMPPGVEAAAPVAIAQTSTQTASTTAPAAMFPKAALPLRAQAPAPQRTQTAIDRDPALLSPSLTTSNMAGTFAQSTPLGSSFALLAPPQSANAPAPPPVVVASVAPTAPSIPAALEEPTPIKDVPLPLPRPSSLGALSKVPPVLGVQRPAVARVAPGAASVPTAAAPAAPGFFEKMFGGARSSGTTALAYASPEDGVVGGILGGATPRPGAYDRYTAIYDITNHVVHLPDGTRLEAHSGLGEYKDNPAGVALRMVGATPPNLYQLTFREAPFHGVRALRLTPLGGTTFGRAGLLAHTYMLRGRPPGESNGCVVFADYERFLRAYESGAIRRLAVVARM